VICKRSPGNICLKKEQSMTSAVRAGLIGAGVGAASMFLLDPNRGARRRALVRDKAVWASRKTRDAAEATRRDLNNRLTGLQARVRNQFADDAADDATLHARVRAALGRVTSHPRTISVGVMNGVVTVSGDVLEAEASAVESAIAGVRGVDSVRCDFKTYASAEGIPSLQGGGDNRSASWSSWMSPDNWSPTACVACTGLTIGAVALAVMRAWGNGHSTDERDPRSMPVEEGAAAFMTEAGILCASPSETEYGPNTFFS
jgi:osmotically-inducible protein OsmY